MPMMNDVVKPQWEKIFLRIRKFLIPISLLIVFLAIRLPSLGQFVTADEALWLRSSANFYHAVRSGKWEGTFQSSHPGVTTMLAGAIGFHWVFPEYEHMGEAEISDGHLRRLLLRKGVNPIEVLAAGRAASVMFSAIAFLALWPFARKVLGEGGAFAGMLLLALDPFLIGQQRFLHQDGILTAFMLLSLFAFLAYRKDGKAGALIVSGFSAGLAGLTKTPGWFLIPLIVLVTLWDWWKSKEGREKNIWPTLQSIFIWAGAAALAVVIFFPAMWVKPFEMISTMLLYALDSAEGVYSGHVFFLGKIFPNGDLGVLSGAFYAISTLWRSTPITVIGLALSAFWILRDYFQNRKVQHDGVLIIFLFVAIFYLLMTIGTKKFDRYFLPAMGALMMLAGWGLARLFEEIKQRKTDVKIKFSMALALFILILFQISGLVKNYPYFTTYYNPLLGGPSGAIGSIRMGWGEGMEKAASYLMDVEGIEDKKVSSWYSTSFNLLFEHNAEHISINPILPEDELQYLLEQDYLVVYLHQWQRDIPANLLAELIKIEAIYEYKIENVPYVRIYQP